MLHGHLCTSLPVFPAVVWKAQHIILCALPAMQRDDSCLDAVSGACAGLSDEGQVLTQARQLSRCLAFRQLLGEALAEALHTTLPVIGATVDAVASNAATNTAVQGWGSCREDSCGASDVVAGRHVCDLFELPRPGLQGVGSPVVADPVVVNTLVGEGHQGYCLC